MNVEKRQKFIDGIKVSIDTISGVCDAMDLSGYSQNVIKKQYQRQITDPNEPDKTKMNYYLRINLNEAHDGGEMIRSYKQFKDELYELLDDVQAVNFRINRCDIALDSFNDSDYEMFLKVTKLLLCSVAESKDIQNCYHSFNLWTYKSLSIAIKNDSIECENYDKKAASKGLDKAKNRIELRSKRLNCSLEEEFLVNWFNRLDDAIKYFDAVQTHYNRELMRIWLDDIAKPKKQRDFASLTGFLMTYRSCLFSHAQLVDLLKQIGNVNPELSARRFKTNHRIEFFSKTDLTEITKGIKRKIRNYFES